MIGLDELLREIDEAPRGAGVAAFFAFEGAVVARWSPTALLHELVPGSAPSALRRLMPGTRRGASEGAALASIAASQLLGVAHSACLECGEALFRSRNARCVLPEARRLIGAHLERGHRVVLVSAATVFELGPVARDLGVDDVLGTELECEQGRLTGRVHGTSPAGEGRASAVTEFAARSDIALGQAFYYGTEPADEPLLGRVAQPVLVNAAAALSREAGSRGWRIAQFRSRERPGPGTCLRSLAAMSCLAPCYAMGLPIWALSGSRRAAQNFSFSLFADLASALVRLELDVSGEHHLWSHRPAVFVFNHQSKADAIVLARLLRRDVASVGKKELGRSPILGKVLEFGGAVLIDRANSASAIEAMAPLVEVLRHQRKSVVMAPEGTRTLSPRLAPFKKGAFHLAMQAGVPLVPIVIHNSGDIAPKGAFAFRPGTVRVQVLPPVDTAAWRPETVAAHVAEVRGMFLEALGQQYVPEPAAGTGKVTAAPPGHPGGVP